MQGRKNSTAVPLQGLLKIGALVSCFSSLQLTAQICPPNIDFENGNFDNWVCYTGSTTASGGQNQINLGPPGGPVPGRHTMYSGNTGQIDTYGGFPVKCPNGSGNSIRLGNSLGGGEAEGISYDFVIPATQNAYSLIYHYAVVFEDPDHQIYEQPRMTVEVVNLTDNVVIQCASFYFVPYGNILPGFYQSAVPGYEGTPVWCKDWSAVSINLDNLAGKSIRLFFKTADCTFRRHFGYAYIDVNSECTSEFVGASYCRDDTAINVTAPYGYQNYTWYNSNFTQVLGTQQSITFSPPPQAGTTIGVVVNPYFGYGCLDTLYARLIDTMTITAFAGPDALFCAEDPVNIGANPKPGLLYSWSPAAGLSNPNIANPVASPMTTTSYVLSVRSFGGGCLDTDTMVVFSSSVDKTMEVIGKLNYCIDNEDSAVFRVRPADSIQWYRNGNAIPGANDTLYRVLQSGTYYARVWSNLGCVLSTDPKSVKIDVPRKGITYPLEYAVVNKPFPLQARPFGVKVMWEPATFLSNPTSANTNFQGSTDQLYIVRLETASGCVTVDTQMVKIVKNAEINVPDAFTPNGDGLNDILRPVLMGIKELKFFRVFNRWGQLIYETKTARAGWDGRIQGVLQPNSVVVWVSEAVTVDGTTITRKGSAVLIR